MVRRRCSIAKERADVQALVAQARARVEMQRARIEQVKLRLEADVIQPAEANRREAEERAKGDAAQIVEQGRATADVLNNLGKTYNEAGASGRDVLLMQKLVPLLDTIAGTIGDLKVDRMTVLGTSGNGKSGGDSLAANLLSYSEQIKAATGIDVPKLLREKTGQDGTPQLGQRRGSPPPLQQG